MLQNCKGNMNKYIILIISEMLRQDANIKSTILDDNFILRHVFLKIIFVKQIYSHEHTDLQHEVAGYNNTSHEVEIMIDKNNIRQ